MSKYIARNCPCLGFQIGYYCFDRADYCKNCNDCLIKQVIEKCKKEDYFVPKYPYSQYQEGVLNSTLANDILQLFKIEEVE